MLGDVYSREIGVFVYRRADDAAEADKYVKLGLQISRDEGDKRFSAEELEHIPKVGEDYRENRLNELRSVPVEEINDTPY